MVEIVYRGHSGFTVETERFLFAFDIIDASVRDALQACPKPALALVSHRHADHFLPDVEKWQREGLVSLVGGDDLPASFPGARLSPGQSFCWRGAQVRAYGSTDEGVSFLVRADGCSVFHAGDLNLWHWREESTDEEVAQAERAFEDVLATLCGQSVDAAMFPVDPRMGQGFDEGALRFIEALRPRVFVPMHWWDTPAASESFCERALPAGVRAVPLTAIGQSVRLAF